MPHRKQTGLAALFVLLPHFAYLVCKFTHLLPTIHPSARTPSTIPILGRSTQFLENSMEIPKEWEDRSNGHTTNTYQLLGMGQSEMTLRCSLDQPKVCQSNWSGFANANGQRQCECFSKVGTNQVISRFGAALQG